MGRPNASAVRTACSGTHPAPNSPENASFSRRSSSCVLDGKSASSTPATSAPDTHASAAAATRASSSLPWVPPVAAGTRGSASIADSTPRCIAPRSAHAPSGSAPASTPANRQTVEEPGACVATEWYRLYACAATTACSRPAGSAALSVVPQSARDKYSYRNDTSGRRGDPAASASAFAAHTSSTSASTSSAPIGIIATAAPAGQRRTRGTDAPSPNPSADRLHAPLLPVASPPPLLPSCSVKKYADASV
eukprot:365819-Chlamydomonas_euryale.AAC.1